MLPVYLLALLAPPFSDLTHPSRVFGQPRHYRLFLPASYENSAKRYPVIYYFHGHSDRYTLERYDDGKDTVPKILDFVAKNDVIVVAVDGYVAERYTGFYGGTPWAVMPEDGVYDFGAYYHELVSHIDSTLRTLPSRRSRATSGLSMGGFMSLYLSARYPDLIGSASSFNPGPEFYTGDPGRRVLWRPKDHTASHTRTMVRLIRASGDYISQYHEETRLAYAKNAAVDFEFRQDEYHRHWATSIGETFAFHLRAFSNPVLDAAPEVFHHANAYRHFSVWGWEAQVDSPEPGYTVLSGVTQTGLRLTTRRWAPDGPPVRDRAITLTTPPFYKAGQSYELLDLPLSGGAATRRTLTASADGRLRMQSDGLGHQLSIHGPGAGSQAPVLLPVTAKDHLRVPAGSEVMLPIRVYNPRNEPITGIRVEASSEYPTIALKPTRTEIAELAAGAVADLSARFRASLTSSAGDYAPARISVRLASGAASSAEDFDVMVEPTPLPAPAAVEILDGRSLTLPVFRQKGNQGGGFTLQRELKEGKGNGNGILEPGEEAAIWVKIEQGLDPFDKNHWYRAKVYADSEWIEEIADLEEPKQREWTSAKERTSIIRLSPRTPAGAPLRLVLSNESWSFHFTPDVRYGREPLYQAYQLHRRHVHLLNLAAGRPIAKAPD